MNIILESDITSEMQEKYILLELDKFRMPDSTEPVSAYCLLEPLSLEELATAKEFIDLHSNVMPNYRKKNWPYVEHAIEHLMGRWDGQLDSFYTTLASRVTELKASELDHAWDGVIDRH